MRRLHVLTSVFVSVLFVSSLSLAQDNDSNNGKQSEQSSFVLEHGFVLATSEMFFLPGVGYEAFFLKEFISARISINLGNGVELHGDGSNTIFGRYYDTTVTWAPFAWIGWSDVYLFRTWRNFSGVKHYPDQVEELIEGELVKEYRSKITGIGARSPRFGKGKDLYFFIEFGESELKGKSWALTNPDDLNTVALNSRHRRNISILMGLTRRF